MAKRYSSKKFEKARRSYFGMQKPTRATKQNVAKKPKVRGPASAGGVREDLGQR